VIDIVVPQVGEATADVVLVRWLKRRGEAVHKGEPLFEVDTDKYVVEIEAFESGTLTEILVPEGSSVLPRQVVGRLAPAGRPEPEAAPAAQAVPVATREPAPALPRQRGSSPPGERRERILASPKARRLAAELGVDLAELVGSASGRGGLVTGEDVERAVQTRSAGPASGPAVRPLSRARRRIAERMQASKREVPHFYLLLDVDMAVAEQLRRECVSALGWERAPTFTALVVAACGRALEASPAVHVRFSEDGLVARERANVGIAVDVSDGLVVPVLADAGRLPLREVDEGTRALVERAREGRLLEADAVERSMVVSNLGMHGVDAFVAIVDLPDPMILAVGRVAERCVVVDGAPAVRPTCTLALSADHRVLDGAAGARFLAVVKERLERPYELLEA
jgi:pyruvate dehydrogenase E2 component (dihydrolipoamide acetyltransferase)